jgi:hypothetical protein
MIPELKIGDMVNTSWNYAMIGFIVDIECLKSNEKKRTYKVSWFRPKEFEYNYRREELRLYNSNIETEADE